MTKLLHVTDLHFNRRWFNWVAGHAEDNDVIAYTGDFLDIFGAEFLGTQVRRINAWARALPRPLLWCPGNHDVENADAPVSSGAGWTTCRVLGPSANPAACSAWGSPSFGWISVEPSLRCGPGASSWPTPRPPGASRQRPKGAWRTTGTWT